MAESATLKLPPSYADLTRLARMGRPRKALELAAPDSALSAAMFELVKALPSSDGLVLVPVAGQFACGVSGTALAIAATLDPSRLPSVDPGLQLLFGLCADHAFQACELPWQDHGIVSFRPNTAQAGVAALDPGSAGLGLMLALLGHGHPMGRIAASGILGPSLAPGMLPGIQKVAHLPEKLWALLEEHPDLDMVLLPASNLEDVPDDLPQSFKSRLRFVASVDEAVALAFPKLRLKRLPFPEQVRHLELARFRAPYDPEFSAWYRGTISALLKHPEMEHHQAAAVVLHSLQGHYCSHDGNNLQARELLSKAMDLGQELWDKEDAYLSLETLGEVANRRAVNLRDLFLCDEAEALCRAWVSRLADHRGEVLLHFQGTWGQTLTALAACLDPAVDADRIKASLDQSIKLHRKLKSVALSEEDRSRQRCYLVVALDLAGRFPEAELELAELLPDCLFPGGQNLAGSSLAFAVPRLAFHRLCQASPDKWFQDWERIQLATQGGLDIGQKRSWPWLNTLVLHARLLTLAGRLDEALAALAPDSNAATLLCKRPTTLFTALFQTARLDLAAALAPHNQPLAQDLAGEATPAIRSALATESPLATLLDRIHTSPAGDLAQWQAQLHRLVRAVVF